MNDKKRNISEREAANTLKDAVVASLERDKAEDITVIDLKGKTDFAHFMVVTTGRSSKHVGSIADKLLSDLKAEGFYANVEGLQESKWVLIDAWDVVVHIFTAEERENYSLEKMWGFELPTSKTAQDH